MTSEFGANNKRFSGNNDIHMWFASRLMSSLFREKEGDVTKSQLRSTNNEGKRHLKRCGGGADHWAHPHTEPPTFHNGYCLGRSARDSSPLDLTATVRSYVHAAVARCCHGRGPGMVCSHSTRSLT